MSQASGTVSLSMVDTPCSVTLPYLDHEAADIRIYGAKYPVHHFYVRCVDLAQTPLPLDANPRRPENSTQVQAMKDTLEEDPSDFVNRNNGIVILSSRVKHDNNSEHSDATVDSIELDFEEGEGVCNGGHTLLAIQKYAVHEEAIVHLEVIEMDSISATDTSKRKEISDIADARNNNNQLEERSEANFLGYYDNFKEQLANRHVVSWLEGDSDAINGSIDAYQFFRMLKSLDVENYGHPLYGERGKNHSSLATSVTRIHSAWKSEMDDWKTSSGDPESRPLRYLTPLVNDLFYLRDLVSHHLKHFNYPQGVRQMKLYQDYIKSSTRKLLLAGFEHDNGFDLTNPFEVLMIGLFRTNIYLSEVNTDNADLIGWFRSPDTLWIDRSEAILNELQSDYRDGDSDPKNFIRLNGPFTHDFYIHGMSNTVDESPDIVYKIEDGSRYIQVDSRKKATHELTIHDDPATKDILTPLDSNTEGDTLLRQQNIDEIFNFIER